MLEYEKALAAEERKTQKSMQEIDAIYSVAFPKWSLSDSFKNGTLRGFLAKLPRQTVQEAMQIAVARMPDEDRSIKYFCGICWKKIKSVESEV